MKIPFASLAATAALALVPAAALAAPLNVVASFTILADFAMAVGGERVEVTTLVGRDSDIHVYEPRPADAVAMAKADVILVNGLALEGFLDRLIEVSETHAVIVEASAGVDAIAAQHDETEEYDDADHDLHDDAHDAERDHADEAAGDHGHEEAEGHVHGAYDPHAWLSAANAVIYVSNIEAAFCAADPEGCPVYEENALHYRAELAALDADIRTLVATLPEDGRTIITSHDAFAYFGRDYGLSFLAPQGISTETEPSAADVAALIRQIREDKAAALFTESITDPRVVEQIGSETGIAVGGALYAGALSLSEGPAATYVELMRHNAETIAAAIAGK